MALLLKNESCATLAWPLQPLSRKMSRESEEMMENFIGGFYHWTPSTLCSRSSASIFQRYLLPTMI